MRIRGFAPATPCWVELASAEPGRAQEFYASLFGWEPAGDRFKLDGRAVAGLTRTRPGARPVAALPGRRRPGRGGAALRRRRRALPERPDGRPRRSGRGAWPTRPARRSASGRRPTSPARRWPASRARWPGRSCSPTTWPAPRSSTAQTFGWLLRDGVEWLTPSHDAVGRPRAGRADRPVALRLPGRRLHRRRLGRPRPRRHPGDRADRHGHRQHRRAARPVGRAVRGDRAGEPPGRADPVVQRDGRNGTDLRRVVIRVYENDTRESWCHERLEHDQGPGRLDDRR